MAEQELTRERLSQTEVDPKLYYDYEGRFIKQKLERDRLALLPHVLKPAMFARTGWALGDPGVFERLSVAPLSALTCRFIELKGGERSPLQRQIPAQPAYVLAGSGESIQDGVGHVIAAEDVALIPPWTKFQWLAGPDGLTLWLPQVRIWHVLGLLWQEQFELGQAPAGTEALKDAAGQLAGYRVPAGLMGLEEDVEVRLGGDKKRETVFQARRSAKPASDGGTRYDWFLRKLNEENRLEADGPRVVRAADKPWESTRHGKLKYYLDAWSKAAGQPVDVMALEIEPGGSSGKHRHIFEELLLVVDGHGHDTHEATRQEWSAGDLICLPAMTEHQHFNDGDKPARLVSVWARQLAHEYLGGIEHIADASSWKESK